MNPNEGQPAPKPVEPGLRRRGNRQVKVVKLTSPILVENETVEEIEIPVKITIGDIMATDGVAGLINKLVNLIAHLANIPVSSAKQIDIADLMPGSEMGNDVLDFLSRFIPELGGELKSLL